MGRFQAFYLRPAEGEGGSYWDPQSRGPSPGNVGSFWVILSTHLGAQPPATGILDRNYPSSQNLDASLAMTTVMNTPVSAPGAARHGAGSLSSGSLWGHEPHTL